MVGPEAGRGAAWDLDWPGPADSGSWGFGHYNKKKLERECSETGWELGLK